MAVGLAVNGIARPSEDPAIQPNLDGLVLIEGNSIKSMSAPYIPHVMVYGSLIGCLENKESSTGELGDKGYQCDNVLFESEYCAFGCLQFWQETFKEYCMDRYHLTSDPNDIFDCKIQRECADKMIGENWKNIYKWSTHKFCL